MTAMSLYWFMVTFYFFSGAVSQRYVSDAELKQFSENLLSKDTNNVANFVRVQLQGRRASNSSKDNAASPLLVVNPNALKVPTINKIAPIYNNFIPDITLEEVVTNDEITEQKNFLSAVINTPLMKFTKEFLQSKDLIPKTDKGFNEFMYNLWFKLFSRGHRKLSSSAFEHVFLGEYKNGQISGFHNWLYFYYTERQNKTNYLGWSRKLDFPNQKGSILKLHFSWGNYSKPVSSMFIGTSPEFELALYTVCFLTRPNNKCHLSAGGNNFMIQTYTFNQQHQKLLSSAYPNL